MFAEQRYLETSVNDIADRANVAHGTFYRYFDSKDEILREVARDLQRRMMAARTDDAPRPHFDDPSAEVLWRIARANLNFLRSYRDNADLLTTIEQVATFSDELRDMRRETRQAFVDRAERAITRLQARGLACRDLDPHYAAHALGAMVDRFAYVTFVLGDTFELDEAVRTLSLLWARSLGLDIPEGMVVAGTSG